MSLTVHHLGLSQSDRIVWLCEELSLLVPSFKYNLQLHTRDPVTARAPPSLRALHPAGTAPVIVDTSVSPAVTIGESQAIMEYIINVYGQGLLSVRPEAGKAKYAEYLSWLAYANGTLQPGMSRQMTLTFMLKQAKLEKADSATYTNAEQRMHAQLKQVDDHLQRSTYLAGEEFTAADIMTAFSLTTNRGFIPVDLSPYAAILRYLEVLTKRPAYKSAMEKGDPGLEPMIAANVGTFTQFPAFR